MASVKLILYRSKALKSGECPIMIRVIENRKPRYVKTGLTCNPEFWDEKEQVPKRKHPQYRNFLEALDKIKSKVNVAKLVLVSEGNGDGVLQSFKRTDQDATKVIEYARQLEERFVLSHRIGTANSIRFAANKFMTYLGNQDIAIERLSSGLMVKYHEWLLSQNLKGNSVFFYLRTLNTILNAAKKDGIMPSTLNPFEGINLTKYRKLKTRKRAIDQSDINKLIALSIDENDRIFFSRQVFLFSYYCWGINFIDIAYLKWENIRKNVLIYERKKTRDLFQIELMNPAREIIDFYRLREQHGNPYIFPVLSPEHANPRSRDNRINKVLKQVNADLKKLGVQAGISEKLTTYVARHSFANVLKQKGVSNTILKELLGHESEAMTNVYTSQLPGVLLSNVVKENL